MSFEVVKPWARIISDTIAPSLNIEGAESYFLRVGEDFSTPKAVAIDSAGRDISFRTQVDSNVSLRKSGDYRIKYTVRDNYGNVAEVTIPVTVTAINSIPVVDAGKDIFDVLINTQVTLSPTFIDADGDALVWDWTLVSRPDESNASLIDANTPNAALIPDVAGDYVLTVTAFDGYAYSEPSSILINAYRIEPKPRLRFEYNKITLCVKF